MAARESAGTRRSRTRRAGLLLVALALLPAGPAMSQSTQADAPAIDYDLQFVIGDSVRHAYYGGVTEPGYAWVQAVLSIELRGLEGGEWDLRSLPPQLHASGMVAEPSMVTEMRYEEELTSYDGTFGGGASILQYWNITASNPGPVTRTASPGAALIAYDESGKDLADKAVPALVATTGKWRPIKCDCSIGLASLRTFKKWAKLHFSVAVRDGQRIGVVMPTAPNRGEAKLMLDGVNQGRIDTYSPQRVDRVVVWQTPPLDAGVHKVTVVNLATDGRRRIDVDGFLVIGGGVVR